MWRYLKIVQPEPKPNRITNDEDNHKSSIVKVKPGLLLIAKKKLRIYSSPRHIAKPNVCVQRSCLCDESRSLDGRSRATFTIKPVVCCVALRGKVVNDATGTSVRADPPRRRSGCEVSIIVTGAKRNDASRRWRDQKC